MIEQRMNFEKSRIAAEEGERFKALVAEKHGTYYRENMTDDEYVAMTVRAVNGACQELNPESGELTYELQEEQ
jgi:hypothetical protein